MDLDADTEEAVSLEVSCFSSDDDDSSDGLSNKTVIVLLIGEYYCM